MKLLVLVAALVVSFGFTGMKPVNYAGTWTLDAKQSKNLPPYYSEVKSQKLTVTQTDAQLSVAVEIDAGRAAPDRMSFIYQLDGTETNTETSIRTPAGLTNVPTKLKATVGDGGRIHLTISREIPMQGQTIKAATDEDWELSADGQTLTIRRADDTPRGRVQMEMIFVKS